jgi:SAM-dependent methyltransferase
MVKSVAEQNPDLDELMQAIRADIDASQSRAGEPDMGGSGASGAPAPPKFQSIAQPPARVPAAPESARAGEALVAAPAAPRRKKKSFLRRLNIRAFFQRLLGMRRLVKLGARLEALENGPIPLEAVPSVLAGVQDQVRRLQDQLSDVAQQVAVATDGLSALEGKLLARIAFVAIRSQHADGELSDRIAQTGDMEKNVSDAIAHIRDHADRGRLELFEGVEKALSSLDRHWREIADQGRRLDLLVAETRRRSPQPSAAQLKQALEATSGDRLSALCLNFEDRFRGSDSTIEQRRAGYLNDVRRAAEATGRKTVLDVASGRGEFLDLLKANGFEPRGVDASSEMVERCRARGLDATKGEAIDFLRNMSEGQLAAVSGFNVIDHLSYEALIVLIESALRALAPGGLLILETPNPANLIVAAERFYYDPTRRNPLPSEMVAFVVEACGFVDVRILPLNPVNHLPRTYDDPMLSLLQDKIYGPQDYGVIAWKPQ